MELNRAETNKKKRGKAAKNIKMMLIVLFDTDSLVKTFYVLFTLSSYFLVTLYALTNFPNFIDERSHFNLESDTFRTTPVLTIEYKTAQKFTYK